MLGELQKIIAAIPPTQQVAARPAATSVPTAGDAAYSPRWFDLGLQMEGAGGFQAPTFSARDLAWQEATPDQRITQGDSDERVVPGLPAGVRWTNTANRDAYSWWSKADPLSNSVQIVSDPNNPNGFALQVKTADKQGTLIPYALQGNEWVPQQQGIRQFNWDTNDDFGGLNEAAYVLGAAGLGALLAPSATGAAGAAPGAAAQSFPVAAPGAAITSELPALGAAGGAAGAAGGAAGGAASAADIAAMGNVGMGAGGAVVPAAGGAAGSAAGGAMNALSSFLSPNVLNIGSNLLSGFLQDRSARRAADAQMAATQAAIDESRRQFDITRSDMEPWRLAGTDSINQLRTALAPGAEFNRSYTWGDIEGDPIFARTYQTGLAEGTNALRRQLSAAGQRNSGAALKALTRFASDYTNKTGTDALNRWRTGIGDRFNRLSGVAGTGQQTVGELGRIGSNYATNYGNLITSAGNARGASEIARGNAWGGALTNAFNTWQQNRLMDRLLPIG